MTSLPSRRYIGDAQNREIVVGSALLVVAADKPQVEKDVPVHLPSPSVWYDLYTNEQRQGKAMVPNLPHRVPAFVRGGSVVSRKLRQRRATKSQRRDPYTVQVFADPRGEAPLPRGRERRVGRATGNGWPA